MEKTPCPQCGEPNYESSPACWACGAALIGPRAVAPPEPPPKPVDAAEPEPLPTESAATVEPEPPTPDPEDLKPAAREAKALRDKAYVTPPVEVDEGPRGFAEWAAFALQSIIRSSSGFKEALDDYDRRRGRKSGAMSSYGCAVTGLLATLFIALLVAVISYVSRGHG